MNGPPSQLPEVPFPTDTTKENLMPFSANEMTAANRPADTAARLAMRTARASYLRARALKLGYEPAEYEAIEASVLAEDRRTALLAPAARQFESTPDRMTPDAVTP